MLNQELLAIQEKLKKQLKQQIMINTSIFIGGILLFFVFFSNALLLLNNIGTFLNGNIFSHWKILIPSLVDVIILIFCGWHLVTLYKSYQHYMNLLKPDMPEEELLANIRTFINTPEKVILRSIDYSSFAFIPFIYSSWLCIWYLITNETSIIDKMALQLGFVNCIGLFLLGIMFLFTMPVQKTLLNYKTLLLSLPEDTLHLTIQEKTKLQNQHHNYMTQLIDIMCYFSFISVLLLFGCLKYGHELMFKEIYPYNDEYVVLSQLDFKNEERKALLADFKIKEEFDVLSFFMGEVSTLKMSCEIPSDEYPKRRSGLSTLSSKIIFEKKENKDYMTIYYLVLPKDGGPREFSKKIFYVTPELKSLIEEKQKIVTQYCK